MANSFDDYERDYLKRLEDFFDQGYDGFWDTP